MKPVYVNGRFLAQPVSGVQRVAREVLRALDGRLAGECARGRRWVLLCPPGCEAPAFDRIEVRRIGVGDGRGWRGHLWEQRALPRASRDGLLVNLAGTAPAFARGPQIATLHDAAVFDHPEAYTRPFVLWYGWLFERLARRAAALVTVSAWSRERLVAALGVSAERAVVIPNGSDHLDGVTPDDGVLERLGLVGRRFLLVVGSANANKNVARVIEAWRALHRDVEALLVIVGLHNPAVFASAAAPASAGPLSRSRERAGGEGLVQAGALADGELRALYRHATALVFPSLHEGYGLPAVEAMHLGCPVIASREAALPEVCGDAALYVDDPRDPVAIATAMQRLLDEPGLRADLIARGRRQTESRTWAAAAARWLALVDEIAHATSR